MEKDKEDVPDKYECLDCGTIVSDSSQSCPRCDSQNYRNRAYPME